MKILSFFQWHKQQFGRTWTEARKDYLSEGFDKNTVDNVLRDGLENDYKKFIQGGASK